jgi:1,2-diacylglycerol 3-alpha-glucosyltransferase
MKRKKRLKLCLAAILMLLAGIVGYKLYLFIHETDYQALNADNIDEITTRFERKDVFNFAVVGNIRNTMRIFEQRISPMIRGSGANFMISVGNAVADGAEDKYRLLYRGLKKLGIPYVLAAGRNEIEDFGAERFYRHFGPYFFSFHLKNAYFIFLDSTGQTSWKSQTRWLRQELALSGKFKYRFVFLDHSLFPMQGAEPDDNDYVLEYKLSQNLQRLFAEHRVTAVFSAGYPVYHERLVQGVRYFVAGGGGGLLLGQKNHYQFVKVHVGPGRTTYENVAFPHRLGIFLEKIETLKLFLHSFFYMSIMNALLILGIISLVALKLYSQVILQEHYYRDFSVDEVGLSKSLPRVAMFTNNYLPFIGGVPLSIERLVNQLIRQGATVKVFAPSYPQQWPDSQSEPVFRCPTLFYTRLYKFPIANIFSRKINMAIKTFSCDVVHVHHPFWLGKKGMQLARKKGKPVVFTYHTRLEHYTHYIPMPGEVLKNLAAHFLIKHFANRCDAIITPTASTEEYLRNLGVSALIETIPTGINTKDYACWSPEKIQNLRNRYVAPGEGLLISVSRMAKEKNLDFLIDGLAKVKKWSHTPFTCILVGDGPERQRLEEKVTALGMENHVIFSGKMTPQEVAGCYLAADLFVFASTSETQGMVLLEAMAGGCPVVAVRASGVHDVIKDGHNGFKVAESTDDWAGMIVKLLDDHQQLSILSKNSRAFAGDYSVEKIAEKVLALYRRVMVLYRSKTADT